MSRTLVIILSETRASELTFDSIKENVIDPLNADVCVCIGVKDTYNYDDPFYTLAKHRFLYDESTDTSFFNSLAYSYNLTDTSTQYEKLDGVNFLHCKIPKPYYSDNNHKYIGVYDTMDDFPFHEHPGFDSFVHHKPELGNAFSRQVYGIKYASNNWVTEQNVVTYVKRKNYMDFLNVKHHMAADTGNRNTASSFEISTYIHVFFLWFLQKNIIENKLLEEYDRFIIMRSDYIFKLPCPSLSILDKNNIWVPDAEDHGGLCDRFAILSKDNIIPYINILESFYLKSNRYYRNISCEKEWNMERILKMHLKENNVLHLVKRLPYVMYSVRNVNGTTRWSHGEFNKELGYYIKYPPEFQSANLHYNRYMNSRRTIDNYYRVLFGITMQKPYWKPA